MLLKDKKRLKSVTDKYLYMELAYLVLLLCLACTFQLESLPMDSVFPILVYSNEADLTLTLDLEIIIGKNVTTKLVCNIEDE